MLRSRFLRKQTVAIREDGQLLAAAGLDVDGDRAITSGHGRPLTYGGRGLGTHLLTWAEDDAGPRPTLTVATESCGPDAERLYARHGLVCTFAESVRRHDLRSVPSVGPPVGVARGPGQRGRPGRPVHRVRQAPSPTVPASSEPRACRCWLAELDLDPDWRRDLSLLALRKGTSGGLYQRARAAGWTRWVWCRIGAVAGWGATWSPGPSAPWPSRARSPSGCAST